VWFFPPCCPVQVIRFYRVLFLHHVFLSEQIKMMMMMMMFTRFDAIHERDGHPEEQTPRDGIGRSYA